MYRLRLILNYFYWLSWAIIVGGIALIILLAPLAFFALPPLTENSAQAAIYSGKLLTLLFGRFTPICAFLFWFITVLEIRHFHQDRLSKKKIRFYTQNFLLVVNNFLFIYLAFALIPQMETDYFEMISTSGLTAGARQAFREQHQLGNQLIFVCAIITLIIPYFHLTRNLKDTYENE